MTSPENPAVSLARRLRGLREHAWPDVSLTQRDLASALGGSRSLSVPLISSWENQHRPVVPPVERLQSYAAFFATRRSVESHPYRLLDDAELTPAEREQREQLEQQLLEARSQALEFQDPVVVAPPGPLAGPWRFEDGKPITIVCAPVPRKQQEALPAPDDPELAYANLYSYADADSLIELYGHIRAANPLSVVHLKKATYLTGYDYTTHVVLLGGMDWNDATTTLTDLLDLPVSQMPTDNPQARLPTMFRVETNTGEPRAFHPEWDSEDGHLLTDVGHFFRAPNPFNDKRTLTICNGIDSRGVFGMVRALTDEMFRDRNSAYLGRQFAGCDTYSVLTRIRILNGGVVTPDWNLEETRLHEWSTRA